MMDTLFDSPFTPTLLACAIAGLGLGALARLTKAPLAANLAAALVFLIAYYETYQKIPDFPPVGSTNKMFYAAVAAAVLGVLLDSLPPGRVVTWLRRVALLAVPLLIAVWIALPRLAEPDGGLILMLAALVLGGALLLWRLDALAVGAEAATVEPASPWLLLAVLPAVFAPIALFGGSSTSVGLCLGLLVGLGICGLIDLFDHRRLGLTAIFGAAGGLLASIDTVTLITRRVDPLALAVLLLVAFAGQLGARLLLPPGRPGPRLRALAVAVLAATPIAGVLIILLLRNDNPLGN